VERLVSFVRFWIHPVQKLPGAGSRNSLWPEEKREVQRSTGEECVERPDYTSLMNFCAFVRVWYGPGNAEENQNRFGVCFLLQELDKQKLKYERLANKFSNSSDVSQFYRFYRRTRKKFSTFFTIQEYREELGPSVNHHNYKLNRNDNR